MSEDRYGGAIELIDLYVSRAVLYCMRYETGSQWRCFNNGAVLVRGLERVTTRARVFWTRCSWAVFLAEIPERHAFA